MMNDHVLFYACHIQHPNFFVLRLKFLEITLDRYFRYRSVYKPDLVLASRHPQGDRERPLTSI